MSLLEEKMLESSGVGGSSLSQEILEGILILRTRLSDFLAIHIKSVDFYVRAGGHAWEQIAF